MELRPEGGTNLTKLTGNHESTESDESLHLLSHGELELTQSIALNQMKRAGDQATLFLLGRVWYRLEKERRRRVEEIQELERLYFKRTEVWAKQEAAAGR